MARPEELVTGRRLVQELARLGAGQWTPDAVRQWIREEPPCPVAEHAHRGQPHRYRLADVLTWLLARARSEAGKGFTRGGQDPAVPLEAALAKCTGSSSAAAAPPAPEVSPAKSLAPGHAPSFTDPRNRKAYEEARLVKLKADELEGSLVPLEDLQRALDVQAQAFAGALEALEARLAIVLRDADARETRAQLLREQFAGVRDRLILAADLSASRGEGAAP